MSQDPGFDITMKLLLEQKQQMDHNQPAPQSGDNNEAGVGCTDYMAHCRQQNKFPFLALPRHLIIDVFSYLLIKDRMRFRVNKELNQIENESKYHVKKLEFLEVERGDPHPVDHFPHSQIIIFFTDKSYVPEIVRRISKNASIGSLRIDLLGSSKFHRQVFNFAKEFKSIGSLILRFQNDNMERAAIGNSYLFKLAEVCDSISVSGMGRITPKALHQVYKKMLDGSTKLRRLESLNTNGALRISSLRRIGITIRENGIVSSSGTPIEIFAKVSGMEGLVYIFNGTLETAYSVREHPWQNGRFLLKVHETEESLEQAKNEKGLTRIGLPR